jgi:hypothetical protein
MASSCYEFNVRPVSTFQLGVALGYYSKFDESVSVLNDAIGVLQKRIDNLKSKTESKGTLR